MVCNQIAFISVDCLKKRQTQVIFSPTVFAEQQKYVPHTDVVIWSKPCVGVISFLFGEFIGLIFYYVASSLY